MRNEPECLAVVVVDTQISFWRMIDISLKWAIAAIPAITLIVVYIAILTGIIAFILSAFGFVLLGASGG